MQNKGAIRFIAIALALASLFQLSFSFITSKVKKEAAENASGDLKKEAQYLDSISNKVVYNFCWIRKYTYKECLERELNYGLDLKGGMNVILEVSVADVIKALSNNSTDENFVKAMQKAKEYQKDSQDDFITLFGKAFKEVAPQGKLASIFNTLDLKDRVNFNSSNDEVLAVLRDESEAAIANSFNVLRTRIDRFGVTQPNIQQLSGQTGRILVELPGVKDPERVKKLLQGTANLEIWETYTLGEVFSGLVEANQKLSTILSAQQKQEKIADSTEVKEQKSLLDDIDSTQNLIASDTLNQENLSREEFEKRNPLFAALQLIRDENGQLINTAAIGYSVYTDTAKVNEYLNMQQIKDLFPRTLKFLWTVKSPDWDKSGTVYQLVAIKVSNRDGSAQLNGDAITNAREEFNDRNASAMVTMTMNGEGTKAWARITKENIGKQVAIVLDNMVYSFPTVQDEIKGGNTQITGNFTVAEAKDLANILKSGKLPAPAHIIEEEVVGPSLGQAAINSGMWSFVIAFVMVLIYMLIYYRTAGLAANIALICNIFLLFGVLASLGAVLTLPGIAGIVLTMGMAVDANVIIYERIREELHNGKNIKMAIKDGYSASYSAIIDGNVTSLLTGIILYIFGHGPVQGFATTFVIGILTSLFTSIFITRLFFEWFLNKEWKINFWSSWNEFALKNANFDFIGKRKTAYIISSALILISVISMATKKFDPGVDFVGGRTYVVKFDKTVNTVDIAKQLEKAFAGVAPQVKTFGNDNQVKIITKYRIQEEGVTVDSEINDLLYKNLVTVYNVQNVSKEMFLQGFVLDANNNPVLSSDDNAPTFGIQSSSKVGPTIADDIKNAAAVAILLSLIVMFLYILVRFKNWQYGLGATVALIHDTIIVLGAFSLFSGIFPFSMEIDQAFIAAILTIVGYSINDTVVVFDRIREFLGLHPKTEFTSNINSAVNSTLSRTINTSLTTIFVLLSIFIFGGEVIRGFVFALLLGTVVGTYSSLFVATPITYDAIQKWGVKESKEENK